MKKDIIAQPPIQDCIAEIERAAQRLDKIIQDMENSKESLRQALQTGEKIGWFEEGSDK